ncbi:hypothetical protein ON010_g11872 [Phytophthora cinnamomi]|nr:hypothetical protein ON010_g11872 [Phytophthora cinnamomi]
MIDRAEEAALRKQRQSGVSDPPPRDVEQQQQQHQSCTVSQDQLDKLVVDCIYESASPFRHAALPSFIRIFSALCPNLRVPTPKDIGGHLLDFAHDKMMQEKNSMMAGQAHVGVSYDGWANPKREKLVNVVVPAPNMAPVHVCTIATGAESQTGPYMAMLMVRVVDWLGDIIGAGKIATITTDNAPNMKKAWEIIEAECGISCNGCAAHTINLLLKMCQSWRTYSK